MRTTRSGGGVARVATLGDDANVALVARARVVERRTRRLLLLVPVLLVCFHLDGVSSRALARVRRKVQATRGGRYRRRSDQGSREPRTVVLWQLEKTKTRSLQKQHEEYRIIPDF
jgi:hypothetical protein